MADLGFFKEWVTRFESRTVSLFMALKLFSLRSSLKNVKF